MKTTTEAGPIHLLSAQKTLFSGLKRNDLLVGLALLTVTEPSSGEASVEIVELVNMTGVSYARVRTALATLRDSGWLAVERHGGQGSTYTWNASKFPIPLRRENHAASGGHKTPAALRRHEAGEFARMGTSTSLLRDGSAANAALNGADQRLVDVMARELAKAKAARERVPTIAREYVGPEVGVRLAAWMREQIDAYNMSAERVAHVAARAFLKEEGRVQVASHPLGWMVTSGAALSSAIARAAAPKPLEQLRAPRAIAVGDSEHIGVGAGSVLAAIGGAR